MSDDERPAGAYDDHRVLNAIRDTLATGPLHEVHEMPDGTAFVGTAEEAALERTAAISDAYHEGFGAGIGSVQDEFAEQVAAAEQRGYDKAIAKLSDEPRLLAWMKANDDALYLEDHLLFAAYLEAVRDQP